MIPITYIPSGIDEETLRRRALAKVYELLIELSDKAEANMPTPKTVLLEEELEVTLIPSAELETD